MKAESMTKAGSTMQLPQAERRVAATVPPSTADPETVPPAVVTTSFHYT
jgi:hypothetical protein